MNLNKRTTAIHSSCRGILATLRDFKKKKVELPQKDIKALISNTCEIYSTDENHIKQILGSLGEYLYHKPRPITYYVRSKDTEIYIGSDGAYKAALLKEMKDLESIVLVNRGEIVSCIEILSKKYNREVIFLSKQTIKDIKNECV